MKHYLISILTAYFSIINLAAQKPTDSVSITIEGANYRALEKHFAEKERERKKNTDWAKFYRYEKANESVPQSTKVVFMGNSITDNWAKQRPEFFEANNLVGRGIGGQTSSEMLIRFQSDVINLNPQMVVILAGTNDIARNNGIISHDHILGNIKSMCELAKYHKIKPVLCSVLPAYQFGWYKDLQPAEDIKQLNAMIKDYALKNKIPYVDYHSALADEKGGLPEKFAKDGVHPTAEAYEIMEKIILELINKNLK